MYPSGAERSVKARPPSAMYVTSVAATGVNFAKRISAPFRRPTPTAATSIRANPSTQTAG